MFAALNQPVPPEALGGGARRRRAEARGGGPWRRPNAQGAGGQAGRRGGERATGEVAEQSAAPAQRSRAPASATGRRAARAAAGGGRGGGFGGGGGGFRGAGGGSAAAAAIGGAQNGGGAADEDARRRRRRFEPKGGTQNADTIDALFAPLPPVESRGRVWLFVDKQLKPVDVRLGITDGTFTELLDANLLDAECASGDRHDRSRDAAPQAGAAAAGNPFQRAGAGAVDEAGPGGRGF